MADTSTDADAELRLTTAALAEGSISATIKLQAIAGFTATPDVSEDNTAYISVYGGSASSSNLTGEIVLSNGAVKYRDASKSQQTIDGLTYFDDTDINVVLKWTATDYSVSIDGGTTFFGPYVAINTGTATETYQIRIGSSSKESAKELLADDIVIADAQGVEALNEDFEAYAEADDLSTTYSSSAEATVKTLATASNSVARMADTTTDADAELRLTTAALAEGSISTTIKLQAISGFTATEGVDEDNTAYISIYGGSASSSNLTGEIVFSNGAVKYRDASKSQQTIDGLTYADDTDIDVVIDWTATGYSLSIDGGATFYGPYVAINTGAATETYQIRIGSSSKESAKELLADDIVIADATGTQMLSEDFEIYAEGEDLSTTYSSSAEATVRTLAGTTSANNVARMADTSLEADAELRLTTDALAEGSISTTIKLQAISGFTATEGVDEDNTAYISIYGGSASSSNLTGEIVFSNGAVKYRDASKSQQTIDGLTYADDTDIDVVIDWTATGYSLSIDGGATFYGPYVAINTGAATETYQIRIGSSSKESAKELLADDIVIADATGTAVLSEDFETYAEGDDLSTTYSSSAEATIQKD
jgi:hypothetical protein